MIGIFGFNDLHLMQFLYKYTNLLDEEGMEYEVVYWRRSEDSDYRRFDGKAIAFNLSMDTYLPFYKKIVGFLRYTFFMRKIIKQRKYDQLIILTTQTAISLYDVLLKRYAGRYIYDYRDITKEKTFPLYKKMVQRLIKCSYKTAISSKGFLPEIGVKETNKIIIAHNTQDVCKKSIYKVHLHKNGPVRVVYWGMVRQVNFNKRICDIFGNDLRFQLIYHGDGFYRELRNYCKLKGYNNIFFTGRYSTASVSKFAENADILNCLYENDEIQKYAMPVKAYDAIHYRLPVLVSANSYVDNYFSGISAVFSIKNDNSKSITDDILMWYKGLSEACIEHDYAGLEKKVYSEDIKFARMVKTITNII